MILMLVSYIIILIDNRKRDDRIFDKEGRFYFVSFMTPAILIVIDHFIDLSSDTLLRLIFLHFIFSFIAGLVFIYRFCGDDSGYDTSSYLPNIRESYSGTHIFFMSFIAPIVGLPLAGIVSDLIS